jgi:two-component system, OmpR family, KDP operon response regulator KdpE
VTRVLVADDEPQILRALRINLRVRDHEVCVAATGPRPWRWPAVTCRTW